MASFTGADASSQNIRPAVTPDEDPWLFSEQELEDTPSRHKGISQEDECALYDCASMYIRKCASGLGLNSWTTLVAATFFRRFYMLESVTDHETWHVASACIFLACKVCETHKRLRDVINLAVKTRTQNSGDDEGVDLFEDSPDFDREKSAMLAKEAEAMRVLNFDLTVEQPFKHLSVLQQEFFVGYDAELAGISMGISNEELHHQKQLGLQDAWNFLTESIGLYIHVRFDSREIASAGFFLGMHMCGLPLDKLKPGALEYHEVFSCNLAHLEEICHALLDACADANAPFR